MNLELVRNASYFQVDLFEQNDNLKVIHQLIQKHRLMIESEEVSRMLSSWIDSGFGIARKKYSEVGDFIKPLKLLSSAHPSKQFL